MTENELDKFCEAYVWIEKRAEEYFDLFGPDGLTFFRGIIADEFGVSIRYERMCYGECEEETMSIPNEVIYSTADLKELYAKEIEEREWKKMLDEERQEKIAKRNAMAQIENLKRQYNL